MGRKKPPVAPPAPTPSPANHDGEHILEQMLNDDYAGERVVASQPLDSKEGKRLRMLTKIPPTLQADFCKGKVFRLKDWVAVRRMWKDKETGEERMGVSITMVDPSHQTMRFGSDGITRALSGIVEAYIDELKEGYVLIRVCSTRTSNARTMLFLQQVELEETQPEERLWQELPSKTSVKR